MSDRVAVVTGAAQGLGLAISQSLAQDGIHVILVDRSARVKEQADEFADRGFKSTAIVADLALPESIASLASEVLSGFGRCDVLVNNAGVHFKKDGRPMRFEEVTPDDWAQTIAINLTAPLLLAQALVPSMKDRRWGRIVNLSSRAGRTFAAPASPSYAATKAGIIGLTRSMAGQLAPFGITCNCVAPGRIRTPMSENTTDAVRQAAAAELLVGRLGEPIEIGAACSFLASEQAGFITGVVLDVNGGSFMG